MEKGLISMDRFTESSQAYFLTHLHTDHTQGLTSKWGKVTELAFLSNSFRYSEEFGCLMYSGDFQWEVVSERAKDERSRLLNVLKNETVDVVDIIASEPEHGIVIGIDTLGKKSF
ncbi:hypothetical protein POTOM_045703 [Populus tomentosa]|uniref:Metallo-beta-lactamase domain-containing protein n=1 Tax=Populus tomentosa TaxID=118781 RepID=A0A8X7YHE5_POPTO|nr:hypothetical protein POTOM_045703 [Populus tomentosa]